MISHPEGGHFVECFKDKNVSIIYYLLKKMKNLTWHRLKKMKFYIFI